MTFVAGKVLRSVGFDSFADITDAAVSFPGGGVDFDADLTAEQVDAVWWRITSRDAAHEAQRRELAALRDAVTDATDPVAALTVALADYLLGEA